MPLRSEGLWAGSGENLEKVLQQVELHCALLKFLLFPGYLTTMEEVGGPLNLNEISS